MTISYPENDGLVNLPVNTEELFADNANRTQKRVARTRKKLLKAASDLFAEQGLDAVSIEAITERADLGKGTFYRHFSGKNELILALIEDTVNRLIKLIRVETRTFEGPDDFLGHFFSVHAKFYLQHRSDFLMLFQWHLLLQSERDLVEDLEKQLAIYLQTIEQQIVSLVPLRSGKTQGFRLMAYTLAGMVYGILSYAPADLSEAESRERIKSIKRAFVAGGCALLADKLSNKTKTRR